RGDLSARDVALVSRRRWRTNDPARTNGLLRRRQRHQPGRARNQNVLVRDGAEIEPRRTTRPQSDRLSRRAAGRGLLYGRFATGQRHGPDAAAVSRPAAVANASYLLAAAPALHASAPLAQRAAQKTTARRSRTRKLFPRVGQARQSDRPAPT